MGLAALQVMAKYVTMIAALFCESVSSGAAKVSFRSHDQTRCLGSSIKARHVNNVISFFGSNTWKP